jgi:ribosomal protein L29
MKIKVKELKGKTVEEIQKILLEKLKQQGG